MKNERCILLSLIVLSGLILRLAEMNKVLTHDEAYTYVAFASKSFLHAITDYSLPNNHIFHTVLVYFSAELGGMHSWSIRIPALLGGMATIVSVYLLGKALYSPNAGLLAAALTAFFPRLVHYDTIARGYSLLDFFTITSLLFGYQSLRTHKPVYWLLLSLSISLGFWTIPIMLFPAGAIYLWLLLEGVWVHRLNYRTNLVYLLWLSGSGVLAVALTGVLYTPVLYVSGWRNLVGNSFVQPLEKSIWWDEFSRQVGRAWGIWADGLHDILLYALILGFGLSLLFHHKISRVNIPVQLAFLVWLTFLLWYRRPGGFDRLWTFLLPLLFLWSVAIWTELSRNMMYKNWSLSRGLAWFGTGVLVAFTIFSIPGIPERWNKLSNPEAVGIYLAENMRPGEIALIGYDNNATIWFYMNENGLDESYWRARSDFDGVYVVVSENFGEDIESVLRANRAHDSIDPEQLAYLHRYGRILIYYYAP